MKVQYNGHKKSMRVLLPVPYMAKSEHAGEVIFAGPGDVQDVPDDSATNLLEMEGTQFSVPADHTEEPVLPNSNGKPTKAKKGD